MPSRLSISLLAAGIFAAAQPPPAGGKQITWMYIKGQASAWHIEARDEGERFYSLGARYIPEITIKRAFREERLLDMEISLNGFVSASGPGRSTDSDLSLYRLKLRYATAQTETRIGLQKINFGPAYLLRALMWFDRLDPRDPLQLTDGVYGIRFTYSALNNAGLWLWGLYGNDDPKGFELLPTAGDKPEFGGRVQYPVPRGEVALTAHTRRVQAPMPGAGDFTESRFALDGRWDIEIGLWFESVLQRQRTGLVPFEWVKIATLGMDYTLGVGTGLHVLAEHMAYVASEEAAGRDEDFQTSAFSLRYPIGYLDSVSAIGFYSWEEERYYQYMSWSRIWDDLVLNLSFFRYPEAGGRGGTYESNVPAAGYGGQIILIYNH